MFRRWWRLTVVKLVRRICRCHNDADLIWLGWINVGRIDQCQPVRSINISRFDQCQVEISVSQVNHSRDPKFGESFRSPGVGHYAIMSSFPTTGFQVPTSQTMSHTRKVLISYFASEVVDLKSVRHRESNFLDFANLPRPIAASENN